MARSDSEIFLTIFLIWCQSLFKNLKFNPVWIAFEKNSCFYVMALSTLTALQSFEKRYLSEYDTTWNALSTDYLRKSKTIR